MHKAVIVGSTTFPMTAPVLAEVIDIVRSLPEGTMLLTRGSKGFDTTIQTAAILLGIPCFGYPAGGGSDNFLRDIELVKDGDEVLAFFDPDSLHDPNTGTGHVVEMALNAEKPVRAYTVVNDHLVYAGAT